MKDILSVIFVCVFLEFLCSFYFTLTVIFNSDPARGKHGVLLTNVCVVNPQNHLRPDCRFQTIIDCNRNYDSDLLCRLHIGIMTPAASSSAASHFWFLIDNS